MSLDRREFVKAIAVSAAAPALPTPRKPNVILFICDDLGWADLGCYGSKLPTPNLDRLAAQGVRFTRYNTAHPICSASRAALLTGRYASRSHTQGALMPNAPRGMDLTEQTLADLYRSAGYRTHAIGKWHLGDAPAYLPTHRGFDTYYGVPYSDDMQPLPLIRDLQHLEPDTDRDLLTPRYTEEALKVLGEKTTKPFFLYMAFSYPHDPAKASPAFRGKTVFGDYGDSVAEIDWSVGQIMKNLEATGRAKDTLVVFTSDHGPWFQGSPGNLRGRKSSTFEGGSRIPLLARWPGVIPAGVEQEAWATSLNILPTLKQWCGLEQPRLPLDGASMADLFTHKATSLTQKSQIYFTPFGGHQDVHCIRSGDWKLRIAQLDGEIYINDHTAGKNNYLLSHPELYNLRLDPTESYDVARQNPKVVADLTADLESQLTTFPPEIQSAYTQLKQNVASPVTPPGAAPRTERTVPNWAWEPEDRRPT